MPVRARTIGVVSFPEQVRIEFGCRAAADTETKAVDEVARHNSIDWAKIKLAVLLAAGLDVVLHEGFQGKQYPLVVARLLHTVDKCIHRRLTFGQFYSTVLVPECVVPNHGVGFMPRVGTALEYLVGQFVKSIVTQPRRAYAYHLGCLGYDAQLCHHVIGRQRPVSIGQTGIFLYYLDVVDEVDVTLLGDSHVTLLDMQCRVGEDIQVAPEAEVLLVVGDELQVIAQVAVHIHCVLYIIAVEGDGCLTDRRGEGVLQQTDVVVIEVYVGKHVFEHSIKYFARLQYVVDAITTLALDDGLCRLGVFAIHMLRHRLVDRDGQDALVVIGTGLHKVHQPRRAFEEPLLQVAVADVVETEGYLLVFVELVVGVVIEMGALLGCDDTTHELHGRVVLAAVFASACLDHYLVYLARLRFQLDGQLLGGGVDGDGDRSVAYRTECQCPALVAFDAELAIGIARHRLVLSLV